MMVKRLIIESLTTREREGSPSESIWSLCLSSWRKRMIRAYFIVANSSTVSLSTFAPFLGLRLEYGGGYAPVVKSNHGSIPP